MVAPSHDMRPNGCIKRKQDTTNENICLVVIMMVNRTGPNSLMV